MRNPAKEPHPIILVDDHAYIGPNRTYLDALGIPGPITALTSLKSGLEWLEHPELHPSNATLVVDDVMNDGFGFQFLAELDRTESPLKNAPVIILSIDPIDIPNSPYSRHNRIIGNLHKPFDSTALRSLLIHK